MAAAALAALVACAAVPEHDSTQISGIEAVDRQEPTSSWRPAPQPMAGLRAVATSGPEGLVLHTVGGARRFLPGVNLPSTTPGHQPGELAITAEHYRQWFPAMAHLGIRVVRIYTIHPPQFYSELRDYNETHPDVPLFLLHGVYLPDESYVEKQDLHDAAVTEAMSAELRDAVAAVHGRLRRDPVRGRASGSWTADASPWLLGWLAGVEWDGRAVLATDTAHAGTPPHRGRYFTSTADASPTETWIAARLDELATAQAALGLSVPVALVNWPSTDPLRHPDAPLDQEDLAGVDANHVSPTAAWPGGTFASYHAYPYYPDFLHHEPALQRRVLNGRVDPYAGYLIALRDHHAPLMPTMVTEFGVPSSIGSAHHGTLGRDQGGHSEQDAMRIDADMLRTIHDLGLAGGLVFAWTDEWFKFTWNTIDHQRPADRRQLWHDPLTNEQHFGIVATDPAGTQPRQELEPTDNGPVDRVSAAVDESYVHLGLRFHDDPAPATIAVDTQPGGGPPAPGSRDEHADQAFVFDPATMTGQAWQRASADLVVLDYRDVRAGERPPARDGWVPLQLIVNRRLTLPSTGHQQPPQFQDTGVLRPGPWEPNDPAYDSRSTWQIVDGELRVRIPWAMLGIGDPSSRTVVLPGSAGAQALTVERLAVTVDTAGQRAAQGDLVWEPWNAVSYDQRLKAGAAELARAFGETAQ